MLKSKYRYSKGYSKGLPCTGDLAASEKPSPRKWPRAEAWRVRGICPDQGQGWQWRDRGFPGRVTGPVPGGSPGHLRN